MKGAVANFSLLGVLNVVFPLILAIFLSQARLSNASIPEPVTTPGLYTDPDNPFCLSFDNGKCNHCPYDKYALYTNLFGTTCKRDREKGYDDITDDSAKKTINRYCPAGCISGGCSTKETVGVPPGLCKFCVYESNRKLFAFERYGDTEWYQRCVPECSVLGPYYNSEAEAWGRCARCPPDVESCFQRIKIDYTTRTIECTYSKHRYIGTPSITFTDEAFTPGQPDLWYNPPEVDNFPNCTGRDTRTDKDTLISEDNYSKTYYLTTKEDDCMTFGCNGTREYPYPNMNYIFKDLLDIFLLGHKEEAEIKIYLMNHESKNHTWVEDTNIPNHYLRAFERTAVDVTIGPLVCNGANITGDCYQPGEKATVILKSSRILFFVTKTFTIRDIIIDASELTLASNCTLEYQNSSTRCCVSDGDGIPTISNSTLLNDGSPNDAICYIEPWEEGNNPSILAPWSVNAPVYDFWNKGPYAFFVMSFLNDYPKYIPTLVIERCEFRHFWYNKYLSKLIYLDERGSRLTIKDTKFHNCQFYGGLISNIEAYNRDQDSNIRETFQPQEDLIVTSFHNCTTLNSSLTNCYEINIQGSIFQESFWGNYKIGYNQHADVSASYKRESYGTEGNVLNLYDFRGPVLIRDSTFKHLAALKFYVYDSTDSSGTTLLEVTCKTSRSPLDSSYRMSLDRHIQLVSGNENFPQLSGQITLPRGSSVLLIRRISQGITIYNNTFKENAGEGGTAIFLHSLENTKNKPIIIEKNLFDSNFGVEFASAIAIINVKQDYVNLKCEGIYLYENTFINNFGCPYVRGTVAISCLPDKPSTREIGRTINDMIMFKEAYMLGYFVSTNDILELGISDPDIRSSRFTDMSVSEIDDFTKEIFSKFVRDITAKKDLVVPVIHPIHGTQIDTNRISSIKNKFIRNYAFHSHLFIQGAHNTLVQENIFDSNSIPIKKFVPQFLYDIFQGNKLLRYIDEQTLPFRITESTPLVVRMSNYIVIKDSIFTNNTQIIYDAASLPFGSAITIDKHLGAADAIISNTTFHNNKGWTSSDLYQLLNFPKILLDPTSMKYGLEQGVQGALIAYNYWEYMYGIQFYDPNNIPSTASGFFDLKFATPSLIINGCTFSNNSFNVSSDGPVGKASKWTKNYRSAIVKFYNAAEGIGSTQPITGGFKNIYGSLVLQASLVYKNCVFKYNTIYDQRSFINGYGFNALFLQDSIFESNTIIDENLSSQYSLRSYLFGYYEKGVSILNFTVRNVTFNNNSGKICFFRDDDMIDQTESTSKYTTTLETVIISNHLSSPDFILHFLNKQYTKLSGLIATKFTETFGLIFLDTPRNEFELTSIIVKDFNATQVGCLYAKDSTDSNFFRNLTCQNATIITKTSQNNKKDLTNTIDTKLIFNIDNLPVSACFGFSGLSNLNFTDFRCLSSALIGSVDNNDQSSQETEVSFTKSAKKKMICLYQQNTNNTIATGFLCHNAKASKISPGIEEIMVIYLTKTSSKFFSLNFEDNRLNQSFTISKSNVDILDSSFRNNIATTSGSAITSKKNSNLAIANTIFLNNQCQGCEGSIYQETGSLKVISSVFLSNRAEIAAAISMSRSTAIIENSTFIENNATVRYSVINSQLTEIVIMKSTFERNAAQAGQLAIYFYGAEITVKDTIFSKNKAAIGSLNVGIRDASSFMIDNCTFVGRKNEVTASSTGGFIEILDSGGTVTKSTFIDATSNYGGAIYFKSDGQLTLSVKDSTFQGCRASTQGEAIYAQGNGNLVLNVENVIFSCGTSSIYRSNNVDLYTVYCEKMICQILNVTFNPKDADSDAGNQLYLNEGHSHTINRTNFISDCEAIGNCDRSTSSALRILDADDVTVLDTLFMGWGDRTVGPRSLVLSIESLGGGVTIRGSEASIQENLPAYTFTNCTWKNNQAKSGGAIYAKGRVKVILNGGTFVNNIATNGGGIYWDSISKFARFILSDGVSFINNKAKVSGGGIYFAGQKIDMQGSSPSFSQNVAQYGSDTASYAVFLEVLENPDPSLYRDFVAQKKQELSIAQESSASSSNRLLSSNNDTFVSGDYLEPPFVILVRDEFGQQVLTDNTSIVSIIGKKLPEGTDIIIIGNTFTPINGQIVTFPMRLYSTPGANVTLNFTLEGFNPQALGRSASDFPKPSSVLSQQIYLRKCLEGERITENNACQKCPNTQYTLLTDSYQQCNNCPEEGICLGLNKYGPKPGYSRFSYSTIKIRKCLNNEACLGAIVTAEEAADLYCAEKREQEPTFCYTGWCAAGYKGNLCGECRDGYGYLDTSVKTCASCSDNPYYYFISILMGLIGLACVLILISTALKKVKPEDKVLVKKYGKLKKPEIDKGQETKQRRMKTRGFKVTETSQNNNENVAKEIYTTDPVSSRNSLEINKPKDLNLTSIYLKMFTSYLQVLGIIGMFDFQWPEQAANFFSSEEKVTRGTAQVFTIDCMLRQSFLKNLDRNSFYSKLLMLEFVPIFVTIITLVVWIFIYWIKYKKEIRSHQYQLKTNIITSIVVILFILHPYIFELSIDAFRCTQVGDDKDGLYLIRDLSIKCWEKDHLELTFKVAFPSIILWGIGPVVLTFLILRCYKSELDTGLMRARYGFLYQEFCPTRYYWEIIITFRKIAMICLASFLSTYSVKIQVNFFNAAIALGLNALLYVLQFKIKPQVTKTLNEMEKRSLISSIITIYCGLFYLSNTLSSVARIIFFILIILANLYFLVFFAIELLRSKAESLLSYSFVKKYFGCCIEALLKFNWGKHAIKEKVKFTQEPPQDEILLKLKEFNGSEAPNDLLLINLKEALELEESEIKSDNKRLFTSLRDVPKNESINEAYDDIAKHLQTL